MGLNPEKPAWLESAGKLPTGWLVSDVTNRASSLHWAFHDARYRQSQTLWFLPTLNRLDFAQSLHYWIASKVNLVVFATMEQAAASLIARLSSSWTLIPWIEFTQDTMRSACLFPQGLVEIDHTIHRSEYTRRKIIGCCSQQLTQLWQFSVFTRPVRPAPSIGATYWVGKV